MKIFMLDDLPAQPWKNGGGVTREIARLSDDKGMLWRLSLADVDRDGPFSHFPGATRILTVVEGAGLRLRHDSGVIEATLGRPVRFSGDLAIDCDLVSGSVRDFNLIFDPARVAADVARLEPGRHRRARAFGVLPLLAPCMTLKIGAVAPGAFAQFEAHDLPIEIDVKDGAAALLVSID